MMWFRLFQCKLMERILYNFCAAVRNKDILRIVGVLAVLLVFCYCSMYFFGTGSPPRRRKNTPWVPDCRPHRPSPTMSCPFPRDEDFHRTPPWNFYWVSEGELAGMAWPQSKANILYLLDQGIRHLITLSSEKKPPVGLCPEIEWTEIPVPEFEAPTLEQIGKFIEICDKSRQQNKAVGIHCRQGRGRTGVMAACFLVRFKDFSPGRAITDIRIKLPGSIETYEQERMVTKFHDYCRRL